MSAGWDSAHQLVRLLAGRWTLLVLAKLTEGDRRYQELHDALEGISYKMLTETLRRAECDGLIVRHLDPGRVNTTTVYGLTDLGRSLDAPLSGFSTWTELAIKPLTRLRRPF